MVYSVGRWELKRKFPMTCHHCWAGVTALWAFVAHSYEGSTSKNGGGGRPCQHVQADEALLHGELIRLPEYLMSNPTRCSVLICTYNRAALLQNTLESLCHQTLRRSEFEVIVVDDGSQDGTCDIVGTFESRLNLRYAYQRNSGLASARNHALFLSQGEIVIFLDDDDVAAPELLTEHLETHQAHPQDNFAVLGYTDLGSEIATDPLMHFVTEDGAFLFSYADIRHGQILGFSHFWGGRSSCKRRFLLQHGTFNPVFRFGCEDIELAFRLSKHGFRVVYNARAITSMVRPYTFDQFCDRLIKQGRSNFVFSRLHRDPEVRDWTEVDEIRKWDRIEPAYVTLRKSGRDLDSIFRYKHEVGIDTAEDREILHKTYWTAFRASKIKGMAEAAMNAGEYRPSGLPQSDTAAKAVR
jgi:glycosyltransferase involved in cell wall biosynthesis